MSDIKLLRQYISTGHVPSVLFVHLGFLNEAYVKAHINEIHAENYRNTNECDDDNGVDDDFMDEYSDELYDERVRVHARCEANLLDMFGPIIVGDVSVQRQWIPFLSMAFCLEHFDMCSVLELKHDGSLGSLNPPNKYREVCFRPNSCAPVFVDEYEKYKKYFKDPNAELATSYNILRIMSGMGRLAYST